MEKSQARNFWKQRERVKRKPWIDCQNKFPIRKRIMELQFSASAINIKIERLIRLPLRHEMGERAGERWCLGFRGYEFVSLSGNLFWQPL
jgi:hypothetical protein